MDNVNSTTQEHSPTKQYKERMDIQFTKEEMMGEQAIYKCAIYIEYDDGEKFIDEIKSFQDDVIDGSHHRAMLENI
ncbi:hypothetical protein H5410_012879 [Solanum commersonii]|uniref:Uncharacterized protein n=1 Tax=Solanum commersonii TaxID=4109 RepID=A0A9J6ASV9_SOLCO|nr:hypothetical protein H5410_012879 [Solanum commersonii]